MRNFLIIKLFYGSILKNHIVKVRTPPTHATRELTVDKAHTSTCLLSVNSQSSKGVKSWTQIPITPRRK